jgi:UDP-N-acetylglucosamine/UDP-N-acetylgalactosamine diphosphorylase
MIYYLDEAFPIRLITLWADPNHGILKQNVPSPNPKLIHSPLIGKKRDLSTVSVNQVMDALFPVQRGAALILAGGQGTRLSFPGPKGLFSIEGKTLFQWLCEKIPKQMPVAIMTSPLNHEETVAYFRKKDHFGLEIDFFQQEMAPFLNEQKEPVDKQGPIGNGNIFRSFLKSGLKEAWAKKGIDFMTVTNIDNPLSNPADPLLIASIQNQEIAVQCIEREAEDHSMGALVEKEGKWEVIEYISLPSDHTHKYAYSGQMAFNFSFFCQMGELELPLHWVKKKSGEDWIWKREQFIFDVLPYAKKIKPICVNRETHYAPVKGLESIEKVKERLRKGK